RLFEFRGNAVRLARAATVAFRLEVVLEGDSIGARRESRVGDEARAWWTVITLLEAVLDDDGEDLVCEFAVRSFWEVKSQRSILKNSIFDRFTNRTQTEYPSNHSSRRICLLEWSSDLRIRH